jgi:hypothetical protein
MLLSPPGSTGVGSEAGTPAPSDRIGERGIDPRRQYSDTSPPEPLDDRHRLMAAWSIHYNGRHYHCNGYRYDRIADAVAYAEQMQSRQSAPESERPSVRDDDVEPPSAADRATMATLSILFEAGVYAFRGFQYDHLADAVSYATSCSRRSNGCE